MYLFEWNNVKPTTQKQIEQTKYGSYPKYTVLKRHNMLQGVETQQKFLDTVSNAVMCDQSHRDQTNLADINILELVVILGF